MTEAKNQSQTRGYSLAENTKEKEKEKKATSKDLTKTMSCVLLSLAFRGKDRPTAYSPPDRFSSLFPGKGKEIASRNGLHRYHVFRMPRHQIYHV
jgi:hypothetical protein